MLSTISIAYTRNKFTLTTTYKEKRTPTTQSSFSLIVRSWVNLTVILGPIYVQMDHRHIVQLTRTTELIGKTHCSKHEPCVLSTTFAFATPVAHKRGPKTNIVPTTHWSRHKISTKFNHVGFSPPKLSNFDSNSSLS